MTTNIYAEIYMEDFTAILFVSSEFFTSECVSMNWEFLLEATRWSKNQREFSLL